MKLRQKKQNINIITSYSDIIKMCHKINLIDIINHLKSYKNQKNKFMSTFSYHEIELEKHLFFYDQNVSIIYHSCKLVICAPEIIIDI